MNRREKSGCTLASALGSLISQPELDRGGFRVVRLRRVALALGRPGLTLPLGRPGAILPRRGGAERPDRQQEGRHTARAEGTLE